MKSVVALMTDICTRQAKRHNSKWAAATQHLRAMRVVATPQMQRRRFKHAPRHPESKQLCGRLQIMSVHASRAIEGASGCGIQHERHRVTVIARKERNNRCKIQISIMWVSFHHPENLTRRMRQVQLHPRAASENIARREIIPN